MRIGSDSEGGPVFAESGALLGISAIDETRRPRRWNEAWVVPAERACGVFAAAVKKIGRRHAAARDTAAARSDRGAGVTTQRAKGARTLLPKSRSLPTSVSASDFDITLLTPAQVHGQRAGHGGLRADFGNWTQYVREAGQVLLVRVSPQFEESVLKMLARGAAATQGMSLPPLKSFTSNFLRLRAYCGDTEVTPIHPFIIEHEVSGRSPIREGLYVFERRRLRAAVPLRPAFDVLGEGSAARRHQDHRSQAVRATSRSREPPVY